MAKKTKAPKRWIIKVTQYLDGAAQEIEHREIVTRGDGDTPAEYVGRFMLTIPPPPGAPPGSRAVNQNLEFMVPGKSIIEAYENFAEAKGGAIREFFAEVRAEAEEAAKPKLALPAHVAKQVEAEKLRAVPKPKADA